MRKTAGRAMLKLMSLHYHYDTSYLNYVLDHAPKAFFKFMKIAPITRYRQVLPVNALFAAKIAGSLLEDCGPCTQLVSDMAGEGKMPPDQIEAVLTRNTGAMAADTLLAFRFAESVAARSPDQDRVRDEVRARWGDAGVIELAFAMQAGRLFPMLKAALGYAKTCQKVTVGKHDIAVTKPAVREAA